LIDENVGGSLFLCVLDAGGRCATRGEDIDDDDDDDDAVKTR